MLLLSVGLYTVWLLDTAFSRLSPLELKQTHNEVSDNTLPAGRGNNAKSFPVVN